jgi:hypothetical protein
MNKILLGLMLLASISAYAEEFPAGLRLPTKAELAKEPDRKKSPTKFAAVTADFNGDGQPDYAFLLININTHKNVLAIKLSSNTGYNWKIVGKGQLDWDSPPMAIELAEPGKYETACGKGYYECTKNEPESITLKNPGLWYSPFDSGGGGIVFWNQKKMIFEQIITSD